MLYMVTFTINIPQNVSIYTIHGSYGEYSWTFSQITKIEIHRASVRQISSNIIKYRPQFPYFAYNQVEIGPKTEILANPRNWPAREKKHTSISTSNPIHQPILFSNIKISRCYYPIIYLCVLKATNGCLTHPAIGK